MLVIANVSEQALPLNHFLDSNFLVFTSSHLFTDAKAHSFQRRLLRGVSPGLASRCELDLHTAVSGLHDRCQSQFWLRLANPPLADDEHSHAITVGRMRFLSGKRYC